MDIEQRMVFIMQKIRKFDKYTNDSLSDIDESQDEQEIEKSFE